MIKVRYNTFETNSSSSHSLVIKKNFNKSKYLYRDDNFCVYDDDKITFFEDDISFGRSPFTILEHPNCKLKYLVGAYFEDKNKLKEIEDTIRKSLHPNIKFKGFDFRNCDKELEYGSYVGFYESKNLKMYLEKNKISFEEFLFDEKYIIIVDGDEYLEWETLKQSGLIDLTNIEKEFNLSDGD